MSVLRTHPATLEAVLRDHACVPQPSSFAAPTPGQTLAGFPPGNLRTSRAPLS